MMLDCHVHSELSHHGAGQLREFVDAALARSIAVLTFTEHGPLPFDQEHRLTEREACLYVHDVERLRRQFEGRIRILCGFEIDYMPCYEEYLKQLLAQYSVDYVLGSVHFLKMPGRTTKLWDHEEAGRSESQSCYWQTLAQAIRCRLFDAVAHPDLILQSGVDACSCAGVLRRLIRLMSAHGLAYEVNCSGWRKTWYDRERKRMLPGVRPYPYMDAVAYADECSVPLVIGSDAHSPEEVGSGIGEAMDALGDRGISSFVYYEKRKPHAAE